MRLVEQAHQLLSKHLQPGDKAIDATIGNGHDTLFLAQTVGKTGQVIGFDIQEAAIEATYKRLLAQGCNAWVQLHQKCHSKLSETIPNEFQGQVAVVIFNLGYLPGGDRSCVTKAKTTLAALTQALESLKPGGMLICMLYPGHPGGSDEAEAVGSWIRGLDERHYAYGFELGAPPTQAKIRGPELWWVKQQA